ncbi:terminase [Adlercreutzia equolifaciens subsp. celatus]|uniref:Terminase large subunit n=1 Tax=Adlercreutzia equolifaciens subsp. celatus DSM 18785 TaxID=1121021 RepID=A0A3N0ASS4_9ACTN|nr:phage terminase large subunit [Adlercreutzia equolifaciens]MCP2077364.1 phage uncharacterized protein (putative large terminase), C-terminal domain-containing protein [Adlercreutzia equolifaciens subsp. celatus DSM 18785]RFT92527.1 hypothetical protein DX904_06260 [Adlercreutzia equolifaciens subsp. celatus]RNL37903.1 hypothetical protein DMP10_06475 [Adlercreutzia equolifaciens subsp. celatus DSM 18785]BCS57528.1 terminase [Adlercreutzia equolifaciens subsp. celatus]
MDYEKIMQLVAADCRDASDCKPFEDACAVLTQYLAVDKRRERAWALKVREIAERKVMEFASAGNGDLADELYRHIEYILRVNAPHDLDSYMLFMEWNREPEKRFWLPRRHVLMPVCQGFQDLADDVIDILVVSLPPRVGKSTTGIFAMTWNMGRNPDDANVMSGYGDKLTVGFHSEALDLIAGDDYRFHEVFPTSNLKDKSMAAETIDLHRKKRFPSLTCRSVGGGTTGAVEIGSKGWLYCDDMVKDREESLSADRMDKLYAAYLAQLADRKKDGAKEVHVGTRWVPNDVIGRVIDLYDGDDRVRIINIPALDENGESNFNYLYGVGFTTEYYDDMRRRLVAAGEDDEWCAKYMCEPYWKHGQMFPPEELRYYDELPEGEPDAVIAVCDTKGKGGDYCVQPVGYVYGDRHYIHDVICDNSLPEKHKPRLVDCLVKNDVSLCRYESNVAGSEIAYQVESKCRERGLPLRIDTKYSTENKETRILADAGWVKERCLFRATPPNPDYRKFMEMLTRYTVEGKNAHDDAPDAMSMYKRFACGMAKAVATPMARLI